MVLISPQEAKVYLQENFYDAEFHSLAGGLAGVYSARSPFKDSPNEDVAALIPCGEDAGVLAIADGMGGGRSGGMAAGLAIASLRGGIEKVLSENLPLRSGILDGFEEANQKVIALAVGAATTLSAIEIRGQTIRPYHVGDSKILLAGRRGKIKLETISHSPLGYALEAGIIDEHSALRHTERHLVSNVVGTLHMHIELGPALPMDPLDTLLLSTDGLLDNLTRNEIIDCICQPNLTAVMDALMNIAHRRMENPEEGEPSKPDDLTFLVFRLTRSCR